ncbi:hypothetical protein RI367_000188 [Sorochytrium milnesiophthora]
MAAAVQGRASPGVIPEIQRINATALHQLNVTNSTSNGTASGSNATSKRLTPEEALLRALPQYTPALCSIPENWGFYATRISSLYAKMAYPDLGATSLPFAKLFTPDIFGKVSAIGSLVGADVVALYMQTLPNAIFREFNLTVTKITQTHYSVTCNVISTVHSVSLVLPARAVPASAYASTQQQQRLVNQARERRGVWQKMFTRSPDSAAPVSQAEQVPGGTGANNDPYFRTITFPLWSWYKFQEGQIKEFDIFFDTRSLRAYVPRSRGEHSVRICREFSPNGACAPLRHQVPGLYASSTECMAELTRKPIGSIHTINSDNLICRSLHSFLLKKDAASACKEMGRMPARCAEQYIDDEEMERLASSPATDASSSPTSSQPGTTPLVDSASLVKEMFTALKETLLSAGGSLIDQHVRPPVQQKATEELESLRKQTANSLPQALTTFVRDAAGVVGESGNVTSGARGSGGYDASEGSTSHRHRESYGGDDRDNHTRSRGRDGGNALVVKALPRHGFSQSSDSDRGLSSHSPELSSQTPQLEVPAMVQWMLHHCFFETADGAQRLERLVQAFVGGAMPFIVDVTNGSDTKFTDSAINELKSELHMRSKEAEGGNDNPYASSRDKAEDTAVPTSVLSEEDKHTWNRRSPLEDPSQSGGSVIDGLVHQVRVKARQLCMSLHPQIMDGMPGCIENAAYSVLGDKVHQMAINQTHKSFLESVFEALQQGSLNIDLLKQQAVGQFTELAWGGVRGQVSSGLIDLFLQFEHEVVAAFEREISKLPKFW